MKIERISYRTWRVSRNNRSHIVSLDYRGYHCDCEYFTLSRKECSHIRAVKKLVESGVYD